jgi:hypothetical protein
VPQTDAGAALSAVAPLYDPAGSSEGHAAGEGKHNWRAARSRSSGPRVAGTPGQPRSAKTAGGACGKRVQRLSSRPRERTGHHRPTRVPARRRWCPLRSREGRAPGCLVVGRERAALSSRVGWTQGSSPLQSAVKTWAAAATRSVSRRCPRLSQSYTEVTSPSTNRRCSVRQSQCPMTGSPAPRFISARARVASSSIQPAGRGSRCSRRAPGCAGRRRDGPGRHRGVGP